MSQENVERVRAICAPWEHGVAHLQPDGEGGRAGVAQGAAGPRRGPEDELAPDVRAQPAVDLPHNHAAAHELGENAAGLVGTHADPQPAQAHRVERLAREEGRRARPGPVSTLTGERASSPPSPYLRKRVPRESPYGGATESVACPGAMCVRSGPFVGLAGQTRCTDRECLDLSVGRWKWRRRESNPRPRSRERWLLRA
jgi:hypothetical protein